MHCLICGGGDDIHGPVCSCGATLDRDGRIAELIADIKAGRRQDRSPDRLEDALLEVARLKAENTLLREGLVPKSPVFVVVAQSCTDCDSRSVAVFSATPGKDRLRDISNRLGGMRCISVAVVECKIDPGHEDIEAMPLED
jgi:hypothetical protein